MEPGVSQKDINEFKHAVSEILRMLNIQVDESRFTFLSTLAKIEENIESLIEERNYLVRRDERMGITDERSVKAYELSQDKARKVYIL